MGNTKRGRTRRPRKSRALLVALGVGVLALAALVVWSAVSGDAGPAAGGRPGAIKVVHAGGTQIGDTAPVFTARTSTGAEFVVPAGKPVVLFFMTAWCNPQREAAALDRLEREFDGRVAVLGVDIDPAEPAADLAVFADRIGARYSYVHDTAGTLSQALTVKALDTTVIIDAAGRIVYRDATATDEATLRAALTTALARAGVS